MDSNRNDMFKEGAYIALKDRPSHRWRIWHAGPKSCYVKEVNGGGNKVIGYKELECDWMLYKRHREKPKPPELAYDAFGNELHKGDLVYFAYARSNVHGYELMRGTIEKFTNCKVVVSGRYFDSHKLGKVFLNWRRGH